jgi:hypothetical protein
MQLRAQNRETYKIITDYQSPIREAIESAIRSIVTGFYDIVAAYEIRPVTENWKAELML